MLQRSPTYIVSLPAEDPIAERRCGRVLPDRSSRTRSSRWKNVLMTMARLPAQPPPARARRRRCPAQGRRAPAARRATTSTRTSTRATTRGTSACAWCPTATCSRRSGNGAPSIVTDHIETLHRDRHPARVGRRARGRHRSSPPPGSTCLPLGGMQLAVDGETVELPETHGLQGHDARAASRTSRSRSATRTPPGRSRATSTCEYVCRLLNHMDAHGYRACTPRAPRPVGRARAVHRLQLGLRAARASTSSRSRASQPPWRLHQNYAKDIVAMRRVGRGVDGVLQRRTCSGGGAGRGLTDPTGPSPATGCAGRTARAPTALKR